jgi:two-component system response regulator AtoC
MPTLRERPEDIVLLANVFLKEFAEENQRLVKPLTDQALQLLISYPWPGNVRELRTTIEHGVVMSNDAQIDIKHLPTFLNKGQQSHKQNTFITNNSLAGQVDFNLHHLETATIRGALAQTQDNRSRAAELLGISRRTLQRKIKELGI